MSTGLIRRSELQGIADAIRAKTGSAATYKPREMAAAIGNIHHAALVTKTITENGSYDPADDNADGYSRVTVNVAGSGIGVIRSGTAAPSASLGADQDIYIQYSVMPDHVYAYQIDAEYRKIDGSWEAYDPFNPHVGCVAAVRVWTKSMGNTDASLYVQSGTFNKDTSEFSASEEAEVVTYTDVLYADKLKNCNDLVYLDYNVSAQNHWTLTAIHDISGYSAGDIAAQWLFSTNNDVVVYAL